jgi:hypothetical protein
MRQKRPYAPTETHNALYPKADLAKCSCGVLFVRSLQGSEEDDPDKCLPCNRRNWSRLFKNYQESTENGKDINIPTAHVLPIRKQI